jgi:YD repeat-containing protein
MDSRRITKYIPFLLAVGFLTALCLPSLPRASAAEVQLKNDNNTAGGYNGSWGAGDIVGAVLTPDQAMYPVQVLSVDFVLYNQFAGADDSATVRACIYSTLNGRPDTQLGCSDPITITTFIPFFVSVSLAPSEIIIHSPNSFMAAIEYSTGVEGSTPSALTDTSIDIPQGKNYYSKDGGNTWFEHYDFWQQPDQIGFNIVRATVDTNYGTPTDTPTITPTPLRAPTRTPTPIVAPTVTLTPVPRATPYPCDPSSPDNAVYLPLVLKQWQSGSAPPSGPPFGSDVLGVKGYWPYVSAVAGDHQLLVNLSRGNLIIGYVDQDIPAPGIDSVLVRTYNRLSPRIGDFGVGWASNVGNTMRLDPQLDGRVIFFGPSGEIETFTPQGDGFVSPPGFYFTLERHANGTYTVTSISGGIEHRFNSQGQVTSVADRNGNTQWYRRDAAENVVEIVDSVGRSTTLAYTSAGLVASITDPAGRVSQYSYDAGGRRLTRYTNPAGHATEYHYDMCGNLTELIDAGGNVWAFGYDVHERVVLITDPLGDVMQFTYQEGTTLVTDANGHSTVYQYDEGGQVHERVDANGHTFRFAWDQFLNLTRIVSPLGHETQFGWHGNTGLLASVTDALSNTVSFAYDANNNPSSITDARGNITRFSYDATGADLLSVTQADGGRTTFTYDSRGNPLTVTDPNGNAGDPSNPAGIPYRYVYNAHGYLTDAYDPLGNHWIYGWDIDTGNLLSLRDAKGQLTQFTYDVLDRLTSIAYADGAMVSLGYDALSNLITMMDSIGTTTYTYDAVSQLRTEDDPRTEGAIQYGYDAVGNLVSVTRENGAVLTFNYDPADRLVSQSNPFDGGRLIAYWYDADDRLVDIVYPNGDQTTYSYYSNGWMKSLLTTAEDGTIYDQYDYPSQADGGYDGNGNPLQVTFSYALFDSNGQVMWSTETWKMQYDPMNRMVSQEGYSGDGAWLWHITTLYNPNGLWQTRTYRDATHSQFWDYSYDAASRLTSISYWDGRSTQMTNDANGNRIRMDEQFFAGNTRSRLSGPWPRLGTRAVSGSASVQESGLSLREPKTTQIVTATTVFEYDPVNRLRKVVDPVGQWHRYAYDGWGRIVQESSNSFEGIKSYYYDSLGIARDSWGESNVDYVLDLAGHIRSSSDGNSLYYLHRDARDQISHISTHLGQPNRSAAARIGDVSSQLSWYAYYCFQGNLQAVGGGGDPPPPPPPFFSRDRRVTILGGTFLGEVVYHLDDGAIWLHNDQVSAQNSRVTTTSLRPSKGPSFGSIFAQTELLLKLALGKKRWSKWTANGNWGGESNSGLREIGPGEVGPEYFPTRDWQDEWWKSHDLWVHGRKAWATPYARIGVAAELWIRHSHPFIGWDDHWRPFWAPDEYETLTGWHYLLAITFFLFGHD